MNKWKACILGCSLLFVGLVGGLTYYFIPKDEPVKGREYQVEEKEQLLMTKEEGYLMEVIPLDSKEYGIDVRTDFKLKTSNPMNIEYLEERLSIEPERSFHIKQASNEEYILSLEEPLESNTIVKLNYNYEVENKGWAFQTQKPFAVSSTFPGNEGYGVPPNTGIEINFTKECTQDMDDYISISPTVDGTFDYEGNKVIFVPKEDLKADTLYTIRIAKEYSANDESLEEDYIFSFRTKDAKKESFVLLGDSDVFPVDGGQVIKGYNLGENKGEEDLSFNIYRLNSPKDYCNGLKFLNSYDDAGIAIGDIIEEIEYQEVMSFKGDLMSVDGVPYDYVPLVEELTEGYYLIEYDNPKEPDFQVVQVTDLEGYTAFFEKQLFLWAIDTAEDKPLKEAIVSVDGKELGKTDDQGVLLTDLPSLQDKQDYFVYLKDQRGKEIILDIMGFHDPDIEKYNAQRKYNTFIYTDREAYLPTDRIEVFGCLQSKDGKVPDNLKLRLIYNGATLEEKPLRLTEKGSFTCGFNIEDMRQSYIKIAIYEDESIIDFAYVYVTTFEKPTYKMDIDIDQMAIMMGESLHVKAQTTYFEGTPIPDAKIQMSYYDEDNGSTDTILKCDDQGRAETDIVPFKERDSWDPCYYTLKFANLDLQKHYTNYRDSIILFPRDTMVQCKAEKLSDNEIEFALEVNQINLSNFKGSMHDKESFRGRPLEGQEISFDIVEEYYEKEYLGQHYDPIYKMTYDEYRYNKRSNVIQSIDGYTDETGSYSYLFSDIKEGRSYHFEITTYDQQGRKIQQSAYVNKLMYSYEIQENETLQYYDLSVKTNSFSYKKNDEIKAWIDYQGQKIKDNEENMTLFLTCREGLIDYYFDEDVVTTFIAHEDYIPNIMVMALFYDGNYLYKPWEEYMTYDTTEEELNITLETDKQDYKPGENVELSLKVTDYNNQPVQGDINISVVDEAFFALFEDYFNPLNELYWPIYNSGIIEEKLVSKYGMNPFGNGAEKGSGGGDMTLRSEFKNTAYFETVPTNIKGEAMITFSLPDNLTSWRITGTALSSKRKAGKATHNINCKLPYFTDVILFDNYTEGDDIYLTLKTTGTQVTSDMDISYKVSLVNDQGQESVNEYKGKGNTYIYVPLEKQKAGTYTVTVSSKTGDYSDKIKSTINIVQGPLHYFEIMDEAILTEDMELVHNNNPISLTFFNEEACSHLVKGMRIYGMRHSTRMDHKAAAYTAGRYLNEFYGLHLDLDFIKDYESYINENLLAEMTYGSASPYITATVLQTDLKEMLVQNEERKQDMISQLHLEKNNTYIESKEQFASLWALALLDEPILLEVYSAMASDIMTTKKLSFEKIFLLQALIDMGDLEKAKKLYDELSRAYSQIEEDKQYFTGEYKRDYTALMMVAAVKLGRSDDADRMYNYLEDGEDQYYPTQIQQLFYLQEKEPIEALSSFEYTLNGESEKVTLDYDDVLHLTLLPNEAQNITFKEIKGKVTVIKEFIGTINDVTASKGLSIDRQYRVNGKLVQDEEIKVGDKVEVTIQIKSDSTFRYLEVNDILPAGLVYFDETQSSNYYSFYDNNGRKVDIYVFAKQDARELILSYTALAVTKGTYTADHIVVKRGVRHDMAYDEKKELVIR